MPKKTIDEIKQLLDNYDNLSLANKENLIVLLAELENELEHFQIENPEEAIRIAKITKQKIELSKLTSEEVSFDDMKDMALEFETTHPKLTSIIQSICNALASIGI